MKQKLCKLGVVVSAVVLGGYAVANATPINGNINFAGTVSLNTSSAGNATEALGFFYAGTTGNPLVTGADGDFSGLAGTFASFSASTLNPWLFNMATTIKPFWQDGIFGFALESSSIQSQGVDVNGKGYVTVSGSGYAYASGYDNTFGTWTFTTQDPPVGSPTAVFSFSAGSSVGVPDGGITVALLGLALAGLGVARRKLDSAKI